MIRGVQERDAEYYYRKEFKKRKELEDELRFTNECLTGISIVMLLLLATLMYLEMGGHIIV